MVQTLNIFEVGPRDGLQNEKRFVETEHKISLIHKLATCGIGKIEVSSFVSPKWVPQMADAAQVFAGISSLKSAKFAALTPNLKGLERAIEAGADEVAVFVAASESFSQHNTNCSIETAIERARSVAQQAHAAKLPVRGYISCITHCPYEGRVANETVAGLATALLEMGCYEVSLGDTIGGATPDDIATLLDELLHKIPADKLAGHFHDTGNKAIANVERAIEFGLRTFDSAVGGLGGCPYAPGAKGNVETQKIVALANQLGFETGIDLAGLDKAKQFIMPLLES